MLYIILKMFLPPGACFGLDTDCWELVFVLHNLVTPEWRCIQSMSASGWRTSNLYWFAKIQRKGADHLYSVGWGWRKFWRGKAASHICAAGSRMHEKPCQVQAEEFPGLYPVKVPRFTTLKDQTLGAPVTDSGKVPPGIKETNRKVSLKGVPETTGKDQCSTLIPILELTPQPHDEDLRSSASLHTGTGQVYLVTLHHHCSTRRQIIFIIFMHR